MEKVALQVDQPQQDVEAQEVEAQEVEAQEVEAQEVEVASEDLPPVNAGSGVLTSVLSLWLARGVEAGTLSDIKLDTGKLPRFQIKAIRGNGTPGRR